MENRAGVEENSSHFLHKMEMYMITRLKLLAKMFKCVLIIARADLIKEVENYPACKRGPLCLHNAGTSRRNTTKKYLVYISATKFFI